jgi:hypothetical protein
MPSVRATTRRQPSSAKVSSETESATSLCRFCSRSAITRAPLVWSAHIRTYLVWIPYVSPDSIGTSLGVPTPNSKSRTSALGVRVSMRHNCVP